MGVSLYVYWEKQFQSVNLSLVFEIFQCQNVLCSLCSGKKYNQIVNLWKPHLFKKEKTPQTQMGWVAL